MYSGGSMKLSVFLLAGLISPAWAGGMLLAGSAPAGSEDGGEACCAEDQAAYRVLADDPAVAGGRAGCGG